MKEFDGKNILVVDDEEDLRENLAIYLGMKGAKVVKASHGLEALECLNKERFDAVISDIRMPQMSGDLLLDEIKRRNPYEPVVFLVTGFADIDVEDALDRGAEALIRKPYNLEKVCAELMRALTRMSDQGRRSPRFDTIQSVRVFLGESGQEIECHTLNIGRGGMFVRLDGELPERGTLISFLLEAKFENQKSHFVRGKGLCRWTRSKDESPDTPGFGLEFTEIDKESYPLLISLVIFYKTHITAFIPKK